LWIIGATVSEKGWLKTLTAGNRNFIVRPPASLIVAGVNGIGHLALRTTTDNLTAATKSLAPYNDCFSQNINLMGR